MVCQRCGKTVLLTQRFNGLCSACWDKKPRIDKANGVHVYRNVSGRMTKVKVSSRISDG